MDGKFKKTNFYLIIWLIGNPHDKDFCNYAFERCFFNYEIARLIDKCRSLKTIFSLEA